MKNGLIIVGYQGVGKSSCAGRDGCIDLESSNFFIDGERAENWYIPYCQIALSLANQGYTVLVSSHKAVYEFLAKVPLPDNVAKVVIVCPRIIHKELWINRLRERYQKTRLYKDFKALANAKERYEENIQELMHSGLPVYQPAAIDYDLIAYVRKARNDWCEGV